MILNGVSQAVFMLFALPAPSQNLEKRMHNLRFHPATVLSSDSFA
jgi:hypothetical protein